MSLTEEQKAKKREYYWKNKEAISIKDKEKARIRCEERYKNHQDGIIYTSSELIGLNRYLMKYSDFRYCGTCLKNLTLDKFRTAYSNKEHKQTFKSKCKECLKKDMKDYRSRNPTKDSEYYQANKKRFYELSREWIANNKYLNNSYKAKYRAAQRNASVSFANKEEIQAFYLTAEKLTALTGTEYHVDHIDPLQGELACGFHHENNLQVISESKNCSKSNKFQPYILSELSEEEKCQLSLYI